MARPSHSLDRTLPILLAAGAGVVGGRTQVTLGPFQVQVGSQFGPGITEVALPPLGHLTADTHTAPLRFTFTLQDVHAGKLSDLIRDGGVDAVVASVQQGLASHLAEL